MLQKYIFSIIKVCKVIQEVGACVLQQCIHNNNCKMCFIDIHKTKVCKNEREMNHFILCLVFQVHSVNKSVSMMDLQDSRMNSISNLNSVGDMLTSSQASIAGLGHSFGNLCGPLRHMPAGSAGSGLRLSQMGHIGGPTESISQQQQHAAAAMNFPLSFQNPLFHLAAQNSPAQSQAHPPPLLLAPEPENGHLDYQPTFGTSAFSRSEDLSALRTQSSLVQPSIVHSHSYSDDFTRQNQSNDFAWHQLSLQVQVQSCLLTL